jgi:hypothetical protein
VKTIVAGRREVASGLCDVCVRHAAAVLEVPSRSETPGPALADSTFAEHPLQTVPPEPRVNVYDTYPSYYWRPAEGSLPDQQTS